MAIKLNTGRQEVITARVSWTFGTGADIAVQGVYPAIQVPQGAIVLGGHFYCDDATSSSVTITIGDSGSAARYLGSTSVNSTGLTALVPTGYQYTAQTNIAVTVGGADPAAAGNGELIIRYLRVNRAEFSQG
jgi:hypothetical protein